MQVLVPTKKIHVFPVLIENGFKTFAQQRLNAHVGNVSAQSTMFATEAALHDVPLLDVLGLIRVSRYWTGATW